MGKEGRAWGAGGGTEDGDDDTETDRWRRCGGCEAATQRGARQRGRVQRGAAASEGLSRRCERGRYNDALAGARTPRVLARATSARVRASACNTRPARRPGRRAPAASRVGVNNAQFVAGGRESPRARARVCVCTCARVRARLRACARTPLLSRQGTQSSPTCSRSGVRGRRRARYRALWHTRAHTHTQHAHTHTACTHTHTHAHARTRTHTHITPHTHTHIHTHTHATHAHTHVTPPPCSRVHSALGGNRLLPPNPNPPATH